MPQYLDANGNPLASTEAKTYLDANGNPISSTPESAPATPPQQGFMGSFSDSSGLTSLGHALAHPIDTAMGIPATVSALYHQTADNVNQGMSDYEKEGLTEKTRRDFGRAIPVVGPVLATAQSQHDAGNNAGMAGTLAGAVAGLSAPSVLKEVAPAAATAVAKGATAAGETAQDAGIQIMNSTVGALKNDFKRGANPARGYFASGNGISSSMQSIADKATESKNAIGKTLGDAYDKASADGVRIPLQDVQQALGAPLKKAYDLENGPGGTGNFSQLENYAEGFRQNFADAQKNGGFTPRELFDMKRSIAQNTAWSDPTQFNLKAVRQQQAGALSGLLSSTIPETADLNQTYMDLTKLASRAQSRAETGSYPLTKVAKLGAAAAALGSGGFAHGGVTDALLGIAAPIAADSVPVRTAAATALVRGGQRLSSAGGKIGSVFDRTAAADSSATQGFADNIRNAGNETANSPNQLPPPAGRPQLPAPPNAITKGPEGWVNSGISKLNDHIAADPSSGVTTQQITQLAKTQAGRSLLMRASSLKPGSGMMKNLVKQINILQMK